jgi:hypothetical protein
MKDVFESLEATQPLQVQTSGCEAALLMQKIDGLATRIEGLLRYVCALEMKIDSLENVLDCILKANPSVNEAAQKYAEELMRQKNTEDNGDCDCSCADNSEGQEECDCNPDKCNVCGHQDACHGAPGSREE